MAENNYKDISSEKAKKVIKGRARVKSTFKDFLFAEDFNTVVDKVRDEIIYPSLKSFFRDAIVGLIDTAFFGKASLGGGKGGYTNYAAVSSGNNKKYATSRKPVNSVVLSSRVDAEEVLSAMYDRLEKYHAVSVGDFYELIGESGNGYTDRTIGWTSLQGAAITSVRDGWLLELPRYKELD